MLARFTEIILFGMISLTLHAQDRQKADSLYSLGLDYYHSGRYRQSEICLREAFQFYNYNDPADKKWLKYGIDYAEILVDRSKYKPAESLFYTLLEAAKHKKNKGAQARIQNDLGWNYNMAGENTKALHHLRKAIPLAESAKDSLRLGYIYNNIGASYKDQGNYTKSLEYRKKSLAFKKATNNKRSLAIALNNIGVLYDELSLFDQARSYYMQSLAIREKLGHVGLLATAYDNLANLYQELGQYDHALSMYQKSLSYNRQTGNPAKIALRINNIGTLYSKLGQSEQALEYYEQSLQLRSSFAGPLMLATSHKNIGGILWKLNRKEAAVTNYKKALSLSKKSGNARVIARSLLDLAMVEQEKKNLSEALDYTQRARAIADSSHDKFLQRWAAGRTGSIQESQNNFPAAVHSFQQAFQYGKALTADEQLDPLINMATVYDKLHSNSTMYYGRKAVNIIEKQREQAGSLSNFKMDYFSRYSNFYVNMASWALSYKRAPAEAYHYIELSKARSLTDELSQASKRLDEILPEKVRIKRAQMQQNISQLYSSLQQTTNHPKKEQLRDKLRNQKLNYASFENDLHRKYPAYKDLKSPDPVSLKQVKSLCRPQTAILEYAVNDRKLVAFFITRDTVQSRQIALHSTGKTTDLASAVSRFRKGIVDKLPEDSLAQLGKPLYQKLVAPFEHQLSSYSNLIIVPSNYLAYLPFEALKEGNNYLVSKYNIKYLPSMTCFSFIQKERSLDRQKVLVIGNSSSEDHSGTALLPSVDLEVAGVSKLFDDASVLQYRNVTEKNVKKDIQQPFSVVHIAAHSVIDEQHPSMSGIILNHQRPETGLGNDGKLRSSEIYRLSIPSNLVVLSACESGMGDVINGEGILGMQRAFLNAGASTVIASLWNIYDRPTSRFMKLFYKSYLQDEEPNWNQSWHHFLRYIGWDDSVPFGQTARAIRRAKLKMLHSAEYHHPIYWAPFVVIGR